MSGKRSARVWSEHLRQRDHIEDIYVDGITVKGGLKK
jgi:hypothetical protein